LFNFPLHLKLTTITMICFKPEIYVWSAKFRAQKCMYNFMIQEQMFLLTQSLAPARANPTRAVLRNPCNIILHMQIERFPSSSFEPSECQRMQLLNQIRID
jgi:hypothetical protein